MSQYKTVTTQTHVHWALSVSAALFMLAFGIWMGLLTGEIKGTKTYYNGNDCRWVALPHNQGVITPVLRIAQAAEGDLLLCKKAP